MFIHCCVVHMSHLFLKNSYFSSCIQTNFSFSDEQAFTGCHFCLFDFLQQFSFFHLLALPDMSCSKYVLFKMRQEMQQKMFSEILTLSGISVTETLKQKD